MTTQEWVAATYLGLAQLLETGGASPRLWDAPSLCQDWRVRHVVAHVTMPVRMTPERFAVEMADARGDFRTMSDGVAARDGSLPVEVLLDQLRSSSLHAWEPPGGGAQGALSHAVIHSLDVTIAVDQPAVAPSDAVRALLEALTGADGAWFGVDLRGVRLEATDLDWAWGAVGAAGNGGGVLVQGAGGALVALLSGRTLPDGRALPRR